MIKKNKYSETASDSEEAETKDCVLVVEDDADLQLVVASELSDDYEVITASDGKAGFDKALEYVPDLVVTDIMMPEMDGIELCRELKSNMLTSHIPVIMLTAKSSVENQIEGLETGADDYVTKPFNMQLLKVRVSNLLESRRLLRMSFKKPFAETETEAFSEDHAESELLETTPLQTRLDREFWEKMCNVLMRNCSEVDFGIDSLAGELGMSRRSLQRKIKAISGRTPIQLITEYRVKKSVKLLRNKSLSITDVAYDAGFSDLSYFYKLFKKEYGKNPSQYRDEEL